MTTVTVYRSPDTRGRRTTKPWAVTVLRDGLSDTRRFDTEEQAQQYAAEIRAQVPTPPSEGGTHGQ